MDRKVKKIEIIDTLIDGYSDCIDLKYRVSFGCEDSYILEIKGIDLSNIALVSQAMQICNRDDISISSLGEKCVAFPFDEFILRG